MSGREILVDTNILLYLLKGNDTIVEMLHGKGLFISFITELELIGYRGITTKEEKEVAALLNDCIIVSLDYRVKEKYVELRKKYSLKLADAIIAATSLVLQIPLISSDKEFKLVKELTLIQYNF